VSCLQGARSSCPGLTCRKFTHVEQRQQRHGRWTVDRAWHGMAGQGRPGTELPGRRRLVDCASLISFIARVDCNNVQHLCFLDLCVHTRRGGSVTRALRGLRRSSWRAADRRHAHARGASDAQPLAGVPRAVGVPRARAESIEGWGLCRL
jgi:hypothetical protein